MIQLVRPKARALRAKAFQEFIDGLSPSEIREAKEQLNKFGFQKDIVGDLPFELAVRVLCQIGLHDIAWLRRVSRRWHAIFASQVLEAEFTRVHFAMYSHTAYIQSPVPLCPTLQQKLETRYAFGAGLPFARAEYLDLSLWQGNKREHGFFAPEFLVAYDSCRIAWVETIPTNNTHLEHRVKIMNLSSGEDHVFQDPNRSRIDYLALSSSLVVVYNVVGQIGCALELETKTVRSFKLPVSNILQAFFILGRKVYCFLRTLMVGAVVKPGAERGGYEYDFDTQTLYEKDTAQMSAFESSLKEIGYKRDGAQYIKRPMARAHSVGQPRCGLINFDNTAYNRFRIPLESSRFLCFEQIRVEVERHGKANYNLSRSRERSEYVLGDEHFLISVHATEIMVYCFIKDLPLYNENPVWRKLRAQALSPRGPFKRGLFDGFKVPKPYQILQ
ncbi:MAG: hypothetical protein M1814_006185 [Vezdaea aestivalis]|nr:MAG: hypothetical protein M1814_006185 [Vezdaea aestivalis]